MPEPGLAAPNAPISLAWSGRAARRHQLAGDRRGAGPRLGRGRPCGRGVDQRARTSSSAIAELDQVDASDSASGSPPPPAAAAAITRSGRRGHEWVEPRSYDPGGATRQHNPTAWCRWSSRCATPSPACCARMRRFATAVREQPFRVSQMATDRRGGRSTSCSARGPWTRCSTRARPMRSRRADRMADGVTIGP